MQKKKTSTSRTFPKPERVPHGCGLVCLLVYVLLLNSCFSHSGVWVPSLWGVNPSTVEVSDSAPVPTPCLLGEQTPISAWVNRTLRTIPIQTISVGEDSVSESTFAAFHLSVLTQRPAALPSTPYAQRNRHLLI